MDRDMQPSRVYLIDHTETANSNVNARLGRDGVNGPGDCQPGGLRAVRT